MDELSAPITEQATALAQFLLEQQAESVVALNLHALGAFTDVFVVCTVRSAGLLRGIVRRLNEHLNGHELDPGYRLREPSDPGWFVVDLGAVVLHLFDPAKRDFYDLERIWFEAPVIWESPDRKGSGVTGGADT